MKSLGLRIALTMSAILLALLLIVVSWVDRQLTNAILQEELLQAEVHANTLLASLQTLMINGSGTLAREWIERLRGTAGIRDVVILSRGGEEAFVDTETVSAVNRFIGEPRFQRKPENRPSIVVQQQHRNYFSDALVGDVAYDMSAPDEISVYLPIPTDAECLTCHGYDPDSLRGVLRLSLSTKQSQERVAMMRRNLWGIAALVVLALGLSLWVGVRYSVLRPIAQLRDGIVRAGSGDRSTRLQVLHQDELGEVSQVFNRMQEALRDSEIRVRAVMDNVIDGVVSIDEEGVIEIVNNAAAQIFGYRTEELIGRNVNILMPEPFHSEHDHNIRRYLETGETSVLGKSREVLGLRNNGDVFPMDIAVSEMWLGGDRRFIGIVRDITERKAQTAALKYQALHDALTGLPNRSLLLDRLQHAISLSRRDKKPCALMIIDLNRFKEINDTLGHHVGDRILQHVASRAKDVLRESDTVARLGGDEFSILLPGANEKQALITASKLLEALEIPINVEEHMLEIGASVGIALYPDHGTDSVTLMKRADVAMYVAKRSNIGSAVYSPEEDQHSVKNLRLMTELRGAIEASQLQLYYQPRRMLETGAINGVEALLRWRHPQHGLLLPEEFVPQAEQVGLIRLLTQWVIRQALTECRELMANNIEVTLSVNLSVKNLQDSEFPHQVARIIKELALERMRLKLEITETEIMSDPVKALETLQILSEMGIKLSIDDYGTGYSSLAYLRQLPVDEIKIDKSFVMAMGHDENSVVIVRSTIDLAHNLGLKVVAEGVETEQAWNLLKSLGCDSAQGYFIAQPSPFDDLRPMLKVQ